MTENVTLDKIVEVTKSLIAKGDIEGARKLYDAAEAIIAQEPEVKAAYESSKKAINNYFDLDKELAAKKFPKAERSGYEYIGAEHSPAEVKKQKFAVYPEKNLDGYIHSVGGEMVVVDDATHEKIEKANEDRAKANKTFEDLVTKRHEESGLSKAVEGKGFFIDWYEPSKAQYEKDHGAQASVSAAQAGTAKSNQLAV